MIPELPSIEPTGLSPDEITALQAEIRALAAERDAVIIAHNYQRPEVQDVADFVGDSLGLSRQAASTEASVIVFCGVHFMAETAAMLAPDKTVLLPEMRAQCSLAATVNGEDVRRWKEKFPGYVAVGYVNTTAEVKAELDYCCTSGNFLDIVDSIPADKGILFLPDFFLGVHLKAARPDRKVEVWMGECHVHKEINARTINARREEHPDAEVLVHPECGCASQLTYCAGVGDVETEGLHIASTEGMVRTAKEGKASKYIVATEVGIIHRLKQLAPDKTFIAADAEAVCAYMKSITLESVAESLRKNQHVITVPKELAERGLKAIDRMVSQGD
jgi:quinolinate synthase